ncbi:exodeoxyribonuclease III, partial [Nocardia brasiliensis]|uniref:exodeoxyribonuclease III n=1 Tax=Nocardia brasiliensis TaxID=37326 RepID=UPI00245678CE
MRLATWNVNSIRSRLDRVAEFLDRQDIDVLAIQETKCRDDQFPFERFDELGYEVAHLGINQWNGVAIVSRVGGGGVGAPVPGEPRGAQSAAPPPRKRAPQNKRFLKKNPDKEGKVEKATQTKKENGA